MDHHVAASRTNDFIIVPEPKDQMKRKRPKSAYKDAPMPTDPEELARAIFRDADRKQKRRIAETARAAKVGA